LEEGVHDLRYIHEERDGDQLAFVAWRKPGDQDYATITAADCVGLLETEPVCAEQRGQELWADFSVDRELALQLDDHRWTYFRFVDRSTKSLPDEEGDLGEGSLGLAEEELTCEWQFSDGVTATGPVVEHLFWGQGEPSLMTRATATACR